MGGGTPSTKDLNNFGGDIPWITPKDLSNYPFRYIQKGERNITKKGLENSSAKLLPKRTVLLTTCRDEILREIARELTETIRNNVAIDWTLKESVQAKMKVLVKRILKKYGYPPDKQKKATETVLEQAALICRDLTEA